MLILSLCLPGSVSEASKSQAAFSPDMRPLMTQDRAAFHPKAHCFSARPTSDAAPIAIRSSYPTFSPPLQQLWGMGFVLPCGLVTSLPLPSLITSGLPQLPVFLEALVPTLWAETSFSLQRGKRICVAHTISG